MEEKKGELTIGRQRDIAIEEARKADSISDYFKLKFEGVLSDYHAMLMVKLHVYVHQFEVDAQTIEKHWAEFSLPKPVNKESFQQIYDDMVCHQWIKLQDDTGKYLYGPVNQGREYMPSLLVNRFQIGLNTTIGRLTEYFRKGSLTGEINEIAEALYEEMVALNVWVSTPLMNGFMAQGDLTLEQAQACRPYSNFFKAGVSFKDFIATYQVFGSDKEIELEGHDKTTILEALLPSCLMMRGICGFSSLCGFLMDSTFPSRNFEKPLLEIATYILVKFHNSYLYRMEMATRPVNSDKSSEERGMEDSTTQLKIFLFDRNRVPYLIRVDMPHKGEPDLHFNIRTAEDKHIAEDHTPIAADSKGIENALQAVRDAMTQLCPNLIKWTDTDRESDEMVLNDMLMLNAMDDVSLDYLKGQKNEENLRRFSELYGKPYDNQAEALFDGYQYFVEKEL